MSKTVLITGCHKGIGLGLVNQYLKEGFKVVATARNLEDANDLKNCLKNAGEDPPIRLDVTDDVSINDAVKATRERIDKLDILINNAGITTKNHPEDKALEIIRKEMLQVYDTDVIGALAVTKAFYPLMENSPIKKVNRSRIRSISLSPDIGRCRIIYSPTIFEVPRIIRPTVFDLFVADPTIIPQDSVSEGVDPTSLPKRKPFQKDGVTEGYNPRDLPRREPSQNAHEPSDNPPPPLKPPPEDQKPDKRPPKPKGQTPYKDPPPESVIREGPKKDPSTDPNSGQRSAARRPKEEEVIEKGHRVPQPFGSIRDRIRGRRYSPPENTEDKNPATTPAGDTSTGPLVSIGPLRRNRPKFVSGKVFVDGKKPPEDPKKPRGDIKGEPDRVGGYGGSPGPAKIDKDQTKGKKKAFSYFFHPAEKKENVGEVEPKTPVQEPPKGTEPSEKPGYGGGETPDWLPGEPTVPKAEVEEESVVGEPPKPEDMASSAPFGDVEDRINEIEEEIDSESCEIKRSETIHRHTVLGVRPDTPNLLDIFYDELKKPVDEEFVVVNAEETSTVAEIFEETNVEATFEISMAEESDVSEGKRAGEATEEKDDGKSGVLKKPTPFSFYTGEDHPNTPPEVSPERPSEDPTPRRHQEWQPGDITETPPPPRPSPDSDPSAERRESKHGPYPKRPYPDPGRLYPGRRGPTEPSPAPGDSNPLPKPGGPIIPPDPGSLMPPLYNQTRSFR